MSLLAIPPQVLRHAASMTDEIHSLAGVSVDAGELLAGRARLLGIAPRGRVSAGGATRLLRALDGWCAITLARKDDLDAVPAMVEEDESPTDPWPTILRWALTRTTAHVVERARLLDVPAASLGEVSPASPRVSPLGNVGPPRPANRLLVADLTSMWAGPLCGQLLVRAGATVVKVESPSRPDGTRAGHPAFFDWMNGGKLSYSIDFDRNTTRLQALLSAADVVLEGSRPAALVRRGIGPSDIPGRPGRVWLRVTGYGTRGDDAQRPAFGDDAAVAGALVSWTADEPGFCGDAIADPLTGMTAARMVFDSLARGGGELIEVAMAEVAASYAALPADAEEPDIPSAPPVSHTRARQLGADDDVVARLLAERVDLT